MTIEFDEVTEGSHAHIDPWDVSWVSSLMVSYAVKFNGMRIGSVSVRIGDKGEILDSLVAGSKLSLKQSFQSAG